MDSIIENLVKLIPPNIDEEWLNNAWDSELMTIDSLPEDFEEYFDPDTCSTLLSNITRITKFALKNVPDRRSLLNTSTEGEDDIGLHALWAGLEANNLTYKKILPIFCYFISNGASHFENSQSRRLGLEATSCYYALLSIPGSLTNNMYHSIMYTQSLNTLKLAIKISPAASKKKKKGKGKQVEFEEDDEDAEEAAYELADHEKRAFWLSLAEVLQDLVLMLQRFSLKGKTDAIEHTIQQFLELTCLEHSATINAYTPMRHNSTSSIAVNAFQGLQVICQPLHGVVSETVVLLMKHILTVLLTTSENSTLNLLPRELNIIRDNIVRFIGSTAKNIGESANKGIIILVQNLITRSTDKVEMRQRAGQMAVLLMRQLPIQLRTKLMRWVFFMAHAERPGHRLMALELVSQLMREEECEDADENELTQEMEEEPPQSPASLAVEPEQDNVAQEVPAVGEVQQTEPANQEKVDDAQEEAANIYIDLRGHHAFKHKHMLGLILYRCDDIAPSVRSKALGMLADFACTKNKYMIEMLQKVFVEPYPPGQAQSSAENERPFLSHDKFIKVLDKTELDALPGAHVIVKVVTRMTTDERVMVRKPALQALVNITSLNRYWLSQDMLELLSQHCRDPAMMIRKQMLQSMTDLLLLYGHNEVPDIAETWLHSVLTNIHDPEIKVQEIVRDMLYLVLIQSMQPSGHQTNNTQQLPWMMLKLIPNNNMNEFLSKAVYDWNVDKKLPVSLVPTLQSHVGTENNDQAWLMLSVLAENKPLSSPAFAYNYFQQRVNTFNKAELPVLYRVMRVMLLSVNHLSPEQRITLKDQLLVKLRQLSLPLELIGVSIDLAAAIEIQEAPSDKEALENVASWCNAMYKNLEKEMDSCLEKSTNKPSEQTVLRQMCLVGDVIRIGNLHTSGRLVRILHSILMADLKVTGTQKLKLHPKKLCFIPSVTVQSVAVATLGKMALQEESIAHELLPSFGVLLDQRKNCVLRSNILSALADLCGRYAVLVDPLIPRMASCLRDHDTNLRQHALVLMVQLLQEDYVKLRHGLFYFLLRMLCDPEPTLQEIANFYLTQNLPKKKPNAMFASFMGALFFFNEYLNHENYSSMRLSRETIRLLGITGKENKPQRMKMYGFMLEQMDDDHRFQTMHRLCMEILGGFVDDKLTLEGAGKALLGDTLAVLSSDDIRLRSMHAKPSDEVDVPDSEEVSTNIMVTARKAVVTAVVKRNVMENIVPVIRSLKIKLQKLKSPLAEDLMAYLRDLMRDFKSEIQDILAGDRQLAAEVAFDIRQLEEREQANARAPTPDSPEPPSIESQTPEKTPENSPDKGTSTAAAPGNVTISTVSMDIETTNNVVEAAKSSTVQHKTKKSLDKALSDIVEESSDEMSSPSKSKSSVSSKEKRKSKRNIVESSDEEEMEQNTSDNTATSTTSKSSKKSEVQSKAKKHKKIASDEDQETSEEQSTPDTSKSSRQSHSGDKQNKTKRPSLNTSSQESEDGNTSQEAESTPDTSKSSRQSLSGDKQTKTKRLSLNTSSQESEDGNTIQEAESTPDTSKSSRQSLSGDKQNKTKRPSLNTSSQESEDGNTSQEAESTPDTSKSFRQSRGSARQSKAARTSLKNTPSQESEDEDISEEVASTPDTSKSSKKSTPKTPKSSGKTSSSNEEMEDLHASDSSKSSKLSRTSTNKNSRKKQKKLSSSENETSDDIGDLSSEESTSEQIQATEKKLKKVSLKRKRKNVFESSSDEDSS